MSSINNCVSFLESFKASKGRKVCIVQTHVEKAFWAIFSSKYGSTQHIESAAKKAGQLIFRHYKEDLTKVFAGGEGFGTNIAAKLGYELKDLLKGQTNGKISKLVRE